MSGETTPTRSSFGQIIKTQAACHEKANDTMPEFSVKHPIYYLVPKSGYQVEGQKASSGHCDGSFDCETCVAAISIRCQFEVYNSKNRVQ